MSDEHAFAPNWISSPGETIADLLRAKELSVSQFARLVDCSEAFANELLFGVASIDGATATKLKSALGGSTSFWMAREAQYRGNIDRLHTVQDDDKKAWIRAFPLKDMVQNGWTEPAKTLQEKYEVVLRYFNVPTVQAWRKKYRSELSVVSFRTSPSIPSRPESVVAWLRQGEIQGNQIECSRWNKENFISALTKIRSLTRTKRPADFIPILRELCASCGVALAIVRTPEGCRASGATRFLSSEKALIQLSFRFLSDDQFWFTFFHEAGHLILHSEDALFLEDGSETTSDEERQANEFAAETLIPREYDNLLSQIPLQAKEVLRFARKIGVSPGIVVGQLQHRRRLTHNWLNGLKRRYVREDIPI